MAKPKQKQAPAAPCAETPATSPQQTAADPAEALRRLEQRRVEVTEQLRDVERQIFDLETMYLEHCNPVGNALKGYEALLVAPQAAKSTPVADRGAVREEDRLFSGSSLTGEVQQQQQ